MELQYTVQYGIKFALNSKLNRTPITAIHTSGIYPSLRLSESYVGQCWTPDQGGVYRVAGSGYGQVRGAKLATTVAEGAILGPELVTNEADRTFSSDTGWWTKGTGWGISGGAAVCSSGSASLERLGGAGAIVGRLYMVVYTVFRTAGTIYARIKGTYGTGRNTSGTFVEVITAGGATSIEFVGSAFTGSIDNISIREVIPVWLAPDTYPTRSVRTRFGTARVPTGTSVGMVSSPAFTNKVTARKTNPTDLANVTKSGDAASVLSVVDDTAALAAAGLSQICSTGKVYKLDNSAGSTTAYAAMSGATGNTNGHSLSAYCRATSGVGQLINAAGSFFESIVGATYKRYYRLAFTPSISDRVAIAASPGAVVYFILPELVESSYLPADPIVPLTAAADTLAAFTRAAVYMEEDTAGVFPTVSVVETLDIGHADNPYTTQATRMSDGSVVPVVAGASWAQNFAVFGTCVPDATIPSGLHILTSFLTTDNYFSAAYFSPTTINSAKRIAATSYIISANYTHAANAPFDYLTIQTIHGMAIRVRPHATMTWSAWATNVTVNGKKPAPLATKYQIGAVLGTGGIAGKHPKVSIFELGNQASLSAYQDRAMLLAGRITG